MSIIMVTALSLLLNVLLLFLFIKIKKKNLHLSESLLRTKNNAVFFNELAHLGVRYSKNKKERLRIFLETIRVFSDCELSGLILLGNCKNFHIKDIFTTAELKEDLRAELEKYFKTVMEKGCPLRIEASERFKNLLLFPVYSGNRIIGELFLINKKNGIFSREDEENFLTVSFHATDVIEGLELSSRLDELIRSDMLTGLENHRAFMERLSFEIERSKRFGREFSVLIIDVDNFAKFNETYGYGRGDEMLMKIGGVIKRSIRSTDFAARYGGESFAIILPETSTDIAMIVAERSRNAINAIRLDNPASPSITISAGISTFPHDGRDTAGLIDAAMQAVYLAKQRGKNRTCTYRNLKQEFLMKG
ncbi:MAG: GGDEF domain-containing protein [Thermodesulfovibrionales bacterium]|nr:GGDEF domain-containing protein [Thermodesulfovibrionales bacterium]